MFCFDRLRSSRNRSKRRVELDRIEHEEGELLDALLKARQDVELTEESIS